MSNEGQHAATGGSRARSGSPAPGLESGTCESEADSGHVWVRRDITDEIVQARIEGYPTDFTFHPGDETGLEFVGGEWLTIPSVVHTVRLSTRIEWWTRNRRTGRLRLLAERDIG